MTSSRSASVSSGAVADRSPSRCATPSPGGPFRSPSRRSNGTARASVARRFAASCGLSGMKAVCVRRGVGAERVGGLAEARARTTGRWERASRARSQAGRSAGFLIEEASRARSAHPPKDGLYGRKSLRTSELRIRMAGRQGAGSVDGCKIACATRHRPGPRIEGPAWFPDTLATARVSRDSKPAILG